jgi:hypothetical protein
MTQNKDNAMRLNGVKSAIMADLNIKWVDLKTFLI